MTKRLLKLTIFIVLNTFIIINIFSAIKCNDNQESLEIIEETDSNPTPPPTIDKKEVLMINNLEELDSYRNKKDLDYMIIFFHANWSKGSNSLKKTYYTLPVHIQDRKNMDVFEINFKNRELTKEFEIDVFPTVIIVDNTNKTLSIENLLETQKIISYEGETLAINEIFNWIKSNTNRQIKEIMNLDGLDFLLSNNDNALLLVNTGRENEIIYENQEDTQNSRSLNITETFRHLSDKFAHTPIVIFRNSTEVKFLFHGLHHATPYLKNFYSWDEKFEKARIILLKNYDEKINYIPSSNFDDFNLKELEKNIHHSLYPKTNYFSQQNFIYTHNNQINFALLILNSTRLRYNEFSDDISLDENENSNDKNNKKDCCVDFKESQNNEFIDFSKYGTDNENLIDWKYSNYTHLNKVFYKHAFEEFTDFFLMKSSLDELSQSTLPIDFNLKTNDELPSLIVQIYNEDNKRIGRYKADKNYLLNGFEITSKNNHNGTIILNNEEEKNCYDCVIAKNTNKFFKHLKLKKLNNYLRSERQNDVLAQKTKIYLENNIEYLLGLDFTSKVYDQKIENYIVLFTRRNTGFTKEVEKLFYKVSKKFTEFAEKNNLTVDKLKFGIMDLSNNDITENDVLIGNPAFILYKNNNLNKNNEEYLIEKINRIDECSQNKNENIGNCEKKFDFNCRYESYNNNENFECKTENFNGKKHKDKILYDQSGVTIPALVEFLKKNM